MRLGFGLDFLILEFLSILSKPNATQLNSKQLALELDTVVTCSTPPHHPTTPRTNFSPTSRRATEQKFGTDTH